jgi:(1->4)-alpha-D-glucan 1-alpha-D-glucosylmutase
MARHEHLRVAATAGSEPMPDRNILYLLYQTLVGAHPLSRDRAEAFLRKAAREAKEHTSWLAPDEEYEARLVATLDAILDDGTFMGELDDLVAQIDPIGRRNSLTQLLWKLTCPGVPDVYQGTELWDHSLVDPDNRRPVDYDERRRLLAELDHLSVDEIVARTDEGLPKLWVLTRALAVRSQHPEAFGPEGGYEIVTADGAQSAHVVAYRRGGRVIAVTQRLSARRGPSWGETTLTVGRGTWHDVLTGNRHEGPRVPMSAVLGPLPAALLVREDP